MIVGLLVGVFVLVVILRRRGRRKRKDASVDGLTELLQLRPERRGRYYQGRYKGRHL